MKKGLIGVLLFAILTCIGSTYGYWNKKITVQLRTKTGSFDFRFNENGEVSASIVDQENVVLEEIDGVDMYLSADQKEAELFFSENLPLSSLMSGKYIRIQYPLVVEEGAVYPAVQEEPDFTKPATQVSMDGRVKGLSMDGKLYNFSSQEDFLLDFNLFYQTNWEDDVLYNYIYIKMTDQSLKMLNAMDERVFNLAEEDLVESNNDFIKVDDQQGVLVEYSGKFTIVFEQVNENYTYQNGG